MSKDVSYGLTVELNTDTRQLVGGLSQITTKSKMAEGALFGITEKATGLSSIFRRMGRLGSLFASQTNPMVAPLTRASSSATSLNHNIQRVNSQLDQASYRAHSFVAHLMKAKTLLMGIAGLSLGSLVAKWFNPMALIQPNADLQSMRLQYATGFALQGSGNFEDNLLAFDSLSPFLKEAALRSPGSTKDMLTAITTAASSLAKARANSAEQAKFGEMVTMLGMSQMGGQVGLAASQIQQMLEGRGGVDSQTFNLLKDSLGRQLVSKGLIKGEVNTNAINTAALKDTRGYFEALTESMKSLQAAGDAYGQSFVGLSSTLAEYVENIQKAAGAPLFEFATEQMSQMASWLEKNQKKIEDMATTVGTSLVSGLKHAVSAVSELSKYTDYIAAALALILVRKSAIAAIDAVSPGGKLDSMFAGAQMFFSKRQAKGAAIVQKVTSLPGKIAALPGKAKAFSSYAAWYARSIPYRAQNFLELQYLRRKQKPGKHLIDLTKIKGPGLISKFIGGFASALTGLSTILLPLIALVIGAAGAFMVLKDTTNQWTIFFHEAIDKLMVSLDTLAAQLSPESNGFMGAIKDATFWLGEWVVRGMTHAIDAIRVVVDGWGALVIFLQSFGAAIQPILSNLVDGNIKKALSAFGNFSNVFMSEVDRLEAQRLQKKHAIELKRQAEKELKDSQYIKDKAAEGNQLKDKDAHAAARPRIHVTINQEIKTDANPDRIAYKVRDILEKSLFTRPLSASEFQ